MYHVDSNRIIIVRADNFKDKEIRAIFSEKGTLWKG
jgi:hypothetical protein